MAYTLAALGTVYCAAKRLFIGGTLLEGVVRHSTSGVGAGRHNKDTAWSLALLGHVYFAIRRSAGGPVRRWKTQVEMSVAAVGENHSDYRCHALPTGGCNRSGYKDSASARAIFQRRSESSNAFMTSAMRHGAFLVGLAGTYLPVRCQQAKTA